MLTFISPADIVNNIISIAAAVILLYFGEIFSTRYRRSRGKDPRDQATCALHILEALQQSDDRSNQGDPSAMTWDKLYDSATDLINAVTEGGNYSRKLSAQRDSTHSGHMYAARGKLEEHRLIDGLGHDKFRITGLGIRLRERVRQYESSDERDAAFEGFYKHQVFPPPPLGKEHGQHHSHFLDLMLPTGRMGHIAFRSDRESEILFIFRMAWNSSSKSTAALPSVEWVSLRVSRTALSENLDYARASSQFDVNLEHAIIEHQLDQVRQQVDMAWQPDDLVAREFGRVNRANIYTVIRWLMPRALNRVREYIDSGWLGNLARVPSNAQVLKDLESTRSSNVEMRETSDLAGEQMLQKFELEDLHCVAWAALIPIPGESDV